MGAKFGSFDTLLVRDGNTKRWGISAILVELSELKKSPEREDTVMTVMTVKWTLDDYHRMLEVGLLEGRHVELLNGEIIEMPLEGPQHAQQSTDTADYLRELLGSRADVRDAKPITLPDSRSEPEPDLAIVEPLRAL